MIEPLAEVLPYWLAVVVAALIPAVVLVTFVAASTFFFIWAERKVSGRIQDRLGPTRVGPLGLLQSLADTIKLLVKEDVAPNAADKFLFRLSPYLAFCASFCAFLALPFGHEFVAFDLSVAAFFMLAVLSSEVFGVMLAGYGSANKWALFGGVREAAQVVSYEVPRSLCVVIPVAVAGTLSLTVIGQQQTGWFWNWNLFHDPFTFAAFFIFFITATASCKRAPFDLAEAESELVAGFHTEYSGMRWSFFFLAEYGSMFAVSGLASLLYLGGWHTGLRPFEPAEAWGVWLGNAFNALVFVAKCWVLVLVMMWMRWSLPRLRIDQVMMTCLKYFLPVSCVLLIAVGVWQVTVSTGVGLIVRYILAGGTVVFVLGVVASLFVRKGDVPRGRLAGVWTGANLRNRS